MGDMPMPGPGEKACKTCGGPSQGYKCDMCGEEMMSQDPNHKCGGDHCMPKCKDCNEAEGKCACGGK